ncbi:MAG: hypothetical protein M3548_17945 [Actinomycetota bacterium]|nr:hypothetical protein [Actinomycetota bacterium]
MDGWETSYGWQCTCGTTSFITFTHQSSAVDGADKHQRKAGEHGVTLVELHTETSDEDDEDDYEDDDYED